VEHRHDFGVRQERGLRADRRHEVADQVRDRQGCSVGEPLAADALVHPGAAALLRARVEIDVETAAARAVGIENVVEADVWMIQIDAAALGDAHAIELFGDGEHAGEHARQRKIRAQLLFRELQPLALQPLGIERYIPGRKIELARGETPQVVVLAQGDRTALPRQLFEERAHFLDGGRHLGRERVLGVVRKADELRDAVSQLENLRHQLAVVPAAVRRALVRSARDPALVELAPQRFALGVHHHGLVVRRIEREEPTRQLPRLRSGARTLENRLRQPRDLAFLRHMPGPRVGRIEHVLVELGLQRRQLLDQRFELGFLLCRQRDAGEAEVAQRVLQQLALPGRQPIAFSGENLLVGTVQALVLCQLGVPRREQRQAGVVGAAQFVAVDDAVHVPDRRPGARQAMMHFLQRHDQRIPRRRGLREQRGKLRAMRIEQLAQHGLDVRDADRRERRQIDVGGRHGCMECGREMTAAPILVGRRRRVENIGQIVHR